MCVFETTVAVDLRRLPRIASRVRRLEEVWASVGFTLVRTFGGGTWLQVLSSDRPNGTIFSGTLREPAPWTGYANGYGLFPRAGADVWPRDEGKVVDLLGALDALESGDRSSPPTTTDVRLVATFIGCEPMDGDASRDRIGASIMTAAGDRVAFPRTRARDFVDGSARIPTGTTWRVGWEPDLRATFAVGGRPLLVTAAYRCSEDGVKVTDVAVAEVVVGPAGPAASPSPPP
jgi:hypothetical protein